MSQQPALDQSEYVEQAYLFQLLRERGEIELPMQEQLEQIQYELLTTTNLPIAVEYLLTELKHSGQMAPAMRKLSHYFTPFQTFLVQQAEQESGRFTMETALQVLEGEAKYRVTDFTPAGLFFFEFEVLCRNRLNYDKGLTAISNDPTFETVWAKWILMLRAQVGLVDLADLLFLASEEYRTRLEEAGEPTDGKGPFLFGRKGRTYCAWQSQARASLSVWRAPASPWLPHRATSETGGRKSRRDSTIDASRRTFGNSNQADGGRAPRGDRYHEVLQRFRSGLTRSIPKSGMLFTTKKTPVRQTHRREIGS